MNNTTILIGGRNLCDIEQFLPENIRRKVTVYANNQVNLKSIPAKDWIARIATPAKSVILFIEQDKFSNKQIGHFPRKLYQFVRNLEARGLDLQNLRLIFPLLKYSQNTFRRQAKGFSTASKKLRRRGVKTYSLYRRTRDCKQRVLDQPDCLAKSTYSRLAKQKLAHIVTECVEPLENFAADLATALQSPC